MGAGRWTGRMTGGVWFIVLWVVRSQGTPSALLPGIDIFESFNGAHQSLMPESGNGKPLNDKPQTTPLVVYGVISTSVPLGTSL